MGWISHGPGSAKSEFRRAEGFLMEVRVQGECPACLTFFLADFSKAYFSGHESEGSFTPANFSCPCGGFIYHPGDESYSEKDAGLTVAQRRQQYLAATLSNGERTA